jgi:hypothetical protein
MTLPIVLLIAVLALTNIGCKKEPDRAGMYKFGSLYIFYFGLDVSDTPAVKIEY